MTREERAEAFRLLDRIDDAAHQLNAVYDKALALLEPTPRRWVSPIVLDPPGPSDPSEVL